MGNFQPTRPKRLTPKIRAWIAIGCLIFISLVLGKATWNIYWKNNIAKENKLAAIRELEELENRRKVMSEKLEKLKTAEGREEEIRNNLPMAKEGEYVLTIIDENDRKAENEVIPTSTPREGLFYRWFKR